MLGGREVLTVLDFGTGGLLAFVEFIGVGSVFAFSDSVMHFAYFVA